MIVIDLLQIVHTPIKYVEFLTTKGLRPHHLNGNQILLQKCNHRLLSVSVWIETFVINFDLFKNIRLKTMIVIDLLQIVHKPIIYVDFLTTKGLRPHYFNENQILHQA